MGEAHSTAKAFLGTCPSYCICNAQWKYGCLVPYFIYTCMCIYTGVSIDWYVTHIALMIGIIIYGHAHVMHCVYDYEFLVDG